jgi:positive regulator of sigma E activity
MKFNQETLMLKSAILALIRQVLTFAGTALVAMGYVQASDIEPVIGALLTIGSVVWSVADKRLR